MKNGTVKVHNLNTYDHEEKFKGQDIMIPAGGYILMNKFEAVEFKSQFKQPIFLKGGVPDPKSYKKLVLEPIDDTINESQKDSKHICQNCGFGAKSAAGLKAHVRANHLQSMEDQDKREELIKEGE